MVFSGVITNAEDLEQFYKKAIELGKVAVDTEFSRKRSYFPEISLIQFGLYDEHVCVDAIENPELLEIVKEILTNTAILKVFHALDQDLSGLNRLLSIKTAPFFDTQIASNICNLGSDISYHNLVKKLLNINLDSSIKNINYMENWLHRPLSQEHIDYALSDVAHLLKSYDILLEKLQELDRLDWLEEEQQKFLKENFDVKSDSGLINGINFSFNSEIVRQKFYNLYIWREYRARRLNIPKNSIIVDNDLLTIAYKGLHSRVNLDSDARGEINELLANPKTYKGSNGFILNFREQNLFDLLKLYIKCLSFELNILDKLMVNNEELKKFLLAEVVDSKNMGLGRESSLNKGWRGKILSERLKNFLSGKIVAKVNGMDIVFTNTAL
jgi:ribonuclease D